MASRGKLMVLEAQRQYKELRQDSEGIKMVLTEKVNTGELSNHTQNNFNELVTTGAAVLTTSTNRSPTTESVENENKENVEVLTIIVENSICENQDCTSNIPKQAEDPEEENPVKKPIKKRYEWLPEATDCGTKMKLIRVEAPRDDNSDSSTIFDDSDADPLYEVDNTSSSESVGDDERDAATKVGPQDDNVEPSVRKGKKRTSNSSEWLKKKAKQLRNSGKRYTSVSKRAKKIEARQLREPCGEKCRLKCSSKIAQNTRKAIFDKYWGLGDLARQRDFISKSLEIIKPAYRYTTTEKGRRNNNAFYFEIDEKRVRVCKEFFKATLDINDRPIRTVVAKKDTGFVSDDLRGKHGNHNKIDPAIKEGVRSHINSIPRIESHYLRQQTSREYIDGGKTLTDLFRDYRNDCISRDQPHANLVMYSRIFNSEFNISFFVPKKDRCELCVAYENCDDMGKEALQAKYDQHLIEKTLSRKEKENDKQNISSNYVVACYDLQAVLPVPRGEVSVFYYKSKLNSYNFTISELCSERVECYFWHEGLGKRGANEIGTCVYRYLEETARLADSEHLEIIFYSDNCCGQQKNRFIFTLYKYAVEHLKIKSITHKFLIKRVIPRMKVTLSIQ